MEIRLQANRPTYKNRVKSGINYWCVAAIIGLIGTWVSGASIVGDGAGIMDVRLQVAISPLAGISTFLWFAAVFWWYRQRRFRTKAFFRAVQEKGDFLVIDDFGVTWGVADVATAKVAWAAVGFYRTDRTGNLELGLPAGAIEVPISELDGAGVDEIDAILRSKGVRKLK